MEADLNIPKTKSVNIFFQFARLYTYISIASWVGTQILIDQDQTCSEPGLRLLDMNLNGSLVLIILNVISLIFIWLKEPFARLEFLVMYALNLCWTGVAVFNTVLNINAWPNECPGVVMVQKTIIVLFAKVHLEVLLTFIMPIPFPFRITFLPTSMLPLYYIFTSLVNQSLCTTDFMNITFGLFFVNFIVLCIGVPLAFALLCTKRASANEAFKFLVGLGSFGQAGVMGLMVMAWMHNEVLNTPECTPIIFAIKTYFFICPIAVGFALIMLLSLKVKNNTSEMENIRDDLLKEREKQQQQQEYLESVQRRNTQIKPLATTLTVNNPQIKDNVSVSYGTISRKK